MPSRAGSVRCLAQSRKLAGLITCRLPQWGGIGRKRQMYQSLRAWAVKAPGFWARQIEATRETTATQHGVQACGERHDLQQMSIKPLVNRYCTGRGFSERPYSSKRNNHCLPTSSLLWQQPSPFLSNCPSRRHLCSPAPRATPPILTRYPCGHQPRQTAPRCQ